MCPIMERYTGIHSRMRMRVNVAGDMQGMHLNSISSERLQHCNSLSTILTGTAM